MPNTAFNTPTTIGGRNGAVIYEGNGQADAIANTQSNYPIRHRPLAWASAYQITPRPFFAWEAASLYGTALTIASWHTASTTSISFPFLWPSSEPVEGWKYFGPR